jgi:hypothetical protein
VNSTPQLGHDEPLSPELVLVLPPELRAQAIASLGPPVWPAPRPRVVEPPTPVRRQRARPLLAILATRVVQLGLIFLAATIVTLAMSLVAHAVH